MGRLVSHNASALKLRSTYPRNVPAGAVTDCQWVHAPVRHATIDEPPNSRINTSVPESSMQCCQPDNTDLFSAPSGSQSPFLPGQIYAVLETSAEAAGDRAPYRWLLLQIAPEQAVKYVPCATAPSLRDPRVRAQAVQVKTTATAASAPRVSRSMPVASADLRRTLSKKSRLRLRRSSQPMHWLLLPGTALPTLPSR